MRTFALWLTISVAALLSLAAAAPIAAQSGIGAPDAVRFAETRVENNFPDSLTLTTTVDPGGRDIASAEIVVWPRTMIGVASPTNVPVQVSESRDGVTLTFRFNSNGTAIPHLPLRYEWAVIDVQGNRYASAESVVVYEDNRFDWQTLQNDDVTVLWHSRPESFGRTVFDIANAALDRQELLFGEPLTFPATILVYNGVDEFGAWNPLAVSERIGGQAFSQYGITTQIVPSFGSQERWLNDVIPHELAHLYFAQTTHSVTEKPEWLDEGVATYVEDGVNKSGLLRTAQRSAENGTLIELSELDRELGNEERTELLYAQGVSVVTFLAQVYGEERLADLFEAYDNGANTETAFEQTFGLDLGGIQAAWLGWLGVSAEATLTPTPLPTPTSTPTVVVALATATPSPTPEAVAEVPTATPTAQATATTTPLPSPTAIPVVIGDAGSMAPSGAVVQQAEQAASAEPTQSAPPEAQSDSDETVVESVFPIGLALFVISMCAFWPSLSVLIMVKAVRARDRALGR